MMQSDPSPLRAKSQPRSWRGNRPLKRLFQDLALGRARLRHLEGIGQRQPDHRHAAVHHAFNHHARQRRALGVGIDRVELLAHLRHARAIGAAYLRFPGGLGLGAPLPALHQADAAVEPVVDRVLEGHEMRAELVLARQRFLVELVEGVQRAVGAGDHADLAAPDQQRHHGVQHFAHVLVERSFVDHHNALQAANVLRPA